MEEPKDEEPPVEEPKDEEPPVEEPKDEEPTQPVNPPKKKKNTLFIVLGIVVVVVIVGIALVMNDKVDIPNPPFIDENGNVNWDTKYELDPGRK